MLDDVLQILRCPHCGRELEREGGVVRCPRGHAFDVARQGYVNLLPGDARAGTADTAAMVAARQAFLGAGHYAPIAAALAEACGEAAEGIDGPLIEVGAGTAYYLGAALERLPGRAGLALDISAYALRHAAKAHAAIGAVACDVWRELPVRDECAALALCAFAPRNGLELVRILRPGGTLHVVTPSAEHLAGLIGPLGLIGVNQRKRERLAEQLDPHLEPADSRSCEVELRLEHADLLALASMGPSAHHLDPDALRERIDALPEPMTATASVTISSHRRRPA